MTYLYHRCAAIAACYLLVTSLFGQIPTFQKAYVGEFGDRCRWVAETADGFLLAGNWSSVAGSGVDGLLIKTDKVGNLVWSKNYGGTRQDWFTSAVSANDGGFIINGQSGGTSSLDAGIWLVKLDEAGEVLWQKTTAGAPNPQIPSAPILAVSGGYVVCGINQHPSLGVLGSFVSMTNNDGETIWSRYYTQDSLSSSAKLRLLAVSHVADSVLYAFGLAGKHTVLAVLDKHDGSVKMAVEYAHPYYSLECSGLKPTMDGNYMLMGVAVPPSANEPRLLCMMKIRPDGEVIWSKAFPSHISWINLKFAAVSDCGWLLFPTEANALGGTEYRMLMKTDSIGNVLWKKSYGTASPGHALGNCIETSDNGIAFAGGIRFPGINNEDDFFLMKTDADGEIAGCCSEKRDFLQPVDFPIEIVPASYVQEDYLIFVPIDLTPNNTVSYFDTSICTVSPRPTLHDTLRFCPSESVTIGDSTYAQPATVSLLIPSATDDCDTLATYTLEHQPLDPNAALLLGCPADITVQANGPVPVQYAEPTAWSDCNCPGLALVRTGGPASGTAFPLGVTTVCYQADDACELSKNCCFTVTVAPAPPPPSDACDTKTSGCLQFELLEVNRDYAQNWAYHVRLTNACADAVRYAYLQVPKGLQALAPINDIVYTTSNGHTFTARNPNFSPFYSVRYHFAAPTLASGQSETFRYVLPPQADVKYIHAAARLFSGVYVEMHLNTFSCPVGTEPQPRPEAGERATEDLSQEIKVYPNPVTHELVLNVQGADAEGGLFRLFDPTGRTVLEAVVQGGNVQFGNTEMPNGLYFFSVSKDGLKVCSGKLVVHR
ncbi:MAG: T9SS type A sorting domain-containing protein [Saprospiraceae bacterium]|nr:T9SS type A sorting domain-containing protein [Saprospiraceae bacterium]